MAPRSDFQDGCKRRYEVFDRAENMSVCGCGPYAEQAHTSSQADANANPDANAGPKGVSCPAGKRPRSARGAGE